MRLYPKPPETPEVFLESPLRRIFAAAVPLEVQPLGQAPALAPGTVQRGGMGVLADQAACPFRAFARHRLRTREYEPPDIGISPSERGNVAHKALEYFWRDVGSRRELLARPAEEIDAAIESSVNAALDSGLSRRHRNTSLERSRALEHDRLKLLLAEWLQVERTRTDFEVVEREAPRSVNAGGLELDLKVDRIDRMPSGKYVVLDYKTSDNLNVDDWDGERPDAPQLPLYAVKSGREVEGVYYAKLVPARVRSCWVTAATSLPGASRSGPELWTSSGRVSCAATRRWIRSTRGRRVSCAIFTRCAGSPRCAPGAARRTKPVSSPVILHELDEPQRRAALDPTQSFTVRAPAGSGKTELLIQRFLRLLAIVKKPEAIVAITFTRKAAGEMLERILVALSDAKAGTPVDKPHLEITRGLARQVLQRDRELGWDLLEHPGRLRVQTIDSLCMSITGEMPWLARLGGMPRIEEDARRLYEEAAHQTLLEGDPEYQQALTTLLRHLDNNSTHARDLIATMLANRDQWLRLLKLDDEGARGALEKALADAVARGLKAVDQCVAPDLRGVWVNVAREAASNMSGNPAYAAIQNLTIWPDPVAADLEIWRGLAGVLLTGSKNEWRKPGGLTVRCGFPTGSDARKRQCVDLIAALQERDGLLEALGRVRELPPPSYSDAQWEVLRALLRTLKLAVAQLRMAFRAERVIDFMELGIAARDALGQIDNPTEVAYRMDSRIEHLLVDEFQDTSRAQFELLEKLTSGWQAGDGRTLFLVGDPMQSIYRFRQAEVGLFGEAEEKGIGGLPMTSLELRLNRRSRPAIVERVNALFSDSFPKINDDANRRGEVHSVAGCPGRTGRHRHHRRLRGGRGPARSRSRDPAYSRGAA